MEVKMRLRTYLRHEVDNKFMTEKAAKCIEHEAAKALGIPQKDADKLQIFAGTIYLQYESDESVELGELLYRCGGRMGG